MDAAGQKDAHKGTGTSCIKTGPGNLFESTGNKVILYSDGQYCGPDLISKNACHSKQIWELLFKKKVTVTAEYLPSALNKHAGIESRRKTNSSECKLAPSVFQRLCVKIGSH